MAQRSRWTAGSRRHPLLPPPVSRPARVFGQCARPRTCLPVMETGNRTKAPRAGRPPQTPGGTASGDTKKQTARNEKTRHMCRVFCIVSRRPSHEATGAMYRTDRTDAQVCRWGHQRVQGTTRRDVPPPSPDSASLGAGIARASPDIARYRQTTTSLADVAHSTHHPGHQRAPRWTSARIIRGIIRAIASRPKLSPGTGLHASHSTRGAASYALARPLVP